jgi:glycosyltransferase involved in cell wall biosynthesis
MKILFVSYEFPPRIFGGLGTYAQHLVRGLRKRGVDVDIIVPVNIRTEGVHYVFAPRIAYWGRYFFAKKAMSLIHSLNRSEKLDLIHFNGPYPIIRSFKVPAICTFHSVHWELTKLTIQYELKSLKSTWDILDLVLRNPIGCLTDIIMAQIVDKITCPSENLAKALRSYCFVDDRKVHIVPNGFDVEEFDKINSSNTAFLEKYSIEKDNFLLYMGRLTPFKGVEYLIEAFKCVKKDCEKLKLVIAGSGSYEFYLRKIAGDTKDIIFTGFVNSDEAKKLLYCSSLAVVIPSMLESLPLAVLEAMACKKPVIASDVGGIPSVVRQGKNGFLIPPKNVKSLSTFIKFLYENQNLSKKMGMFSRKLLEKEFTVDKMVNETLKVYESLL